MAEQIFKKVTEWNSENNDYIAEGEITVTITLHEYRDLVHGIAKLKTQLDYSKEKEKELINEVARLVTENEMLRKQLNSYREKQKEEK